MSVVRTTNRRRGYIRQWVAVRHGPESPDLGSNAPTVDPVHLFTDIVQTDRLFCVWLQLLHQLTDRIGRGRPPQYPVTVYPAHQADALFVSTKSIPQFCWRTDRWPGWVDRDKCERTCCLRVLRMSICSDRTGSRNRYLRVESPACWPLDYCASLCCTLTFLWIVLRQFNTNMHINLHEAQVGPRWPDIRLLHIHKQPHGSAWNTDASSLQSYGHVL